MTTPLAILIALSLAVPALAADWYVSLDGTGHGTSWADATNDLAGAVTACESNYTVWVSNGTYSPARLTIGGGVKVQSKTMLPADVVLDASAEDQDWARVVAMEPSSWLVGCTVKGGFKETFGQGAGVYGGNVSNCIFTGNSGDAMVEGGGAYGCQVYNSLFYGNSAESGGGAHSCTLYNCTLYNNTCVGYGANTYACTLFNCISRMPDLYAANVNDAGANHFSAGPDCGGNGSITVDPMITTNYFLQGYSPCRDAGTNGAWTTGATDLAGNPRIMGAKVDMGCYEFDPPGVYITGADISSVHGAGVGAIRGRTE